MTATPSSSGDGTEPHGITDATERQAADLALANRILAAPVEVPEPLSIPQLSLFSAPPELGTTRSRITPQIRRARRATAGIVIAIGIWGLVTELGLVDSTAFPSVPAFARALAESWYELVRSFTATLASWALGISMGTVLGVTSGVVVGRFAWVDAASDIVVRMFRPLPSLALIPIAVLIAGLGVQMTASLVAFATFWPIFISTRYAVRQIENQYLDSGRAVGLTGWRLVRWVIAPAIAPAVITGIRVSVSIGIVVTVSVQLVAGTGGLGRYVLDAQVNGRTDEVFVGVAAGGALGVLLNSAFLAITRRALPWSAIQRGGGS